MAVLASTANPPQSTRYSVSRGVLMATPVLFCYLPVSFAIGLIAAQSHFSFWEATLFAMFAYSGSSESIGLQLLNIGQPVFSIASTAAVVNLRYFLFLTTLAPKIGHWSAPLRYLFAFTVTDETFAIHANEFRKGTPPLSYVLAINLTCWAAWTGGTSLGHLTGSLISDVNRYGLDFAVPGMFVALVVLQIENRRLLGLALLGAGVAVALRCSPLQNWAVLIAGVVAATVGALVETWTQE